MYSQNHNIIQQAIANLQSNDINLIQESNRIIMEWSQSPQSIREAVDIINTCDDEKIIFSTCRIAQENILHNWMKYSEQDRLGIRNSLANRLVSFQGSETTRFKIIGLIVSIALKDWPTSWPNCIKDFINSAAVSPEMCVLDMQVLSELIVTIHETDTITNFQRRQLINEFDKNSAEIMQMIVWALTNVGFENICVFVIKLLKELCLTAPYAALEPYMPNMYPSLFNSFGLNQFCYKDAITAASNLLFNRSDAKEIASRLLTDTLKIFGTFCQDPTSESYIEIPSYILIFIMEYLAIYGPEIDEICFEGEDIIEDVANLVHQIYSTIINKPPVSEHCEEYWTLWRSVLYRYYRSTNSKNPFEALKPCFQLFQPLIPSIRQSLFTAFPSAAEGGKLLSSNCQACWIFLTSADRSGMISFLEEQAQNPSPSLCYAIGLVDACLSGRDERDMIVKIFPNLFVFNQNSKNVDFGVSLLYAISHAIRFMNKEYSFLSAFGLCLINFLQTSDIKIRSAAVNALFYVSLRQPKLLVREEKVKVENNDSENIQNQNQDIQFEGTIINGVFGVLNFIFDFDLKNSVKLLKSVALVGSSQSNTAIKQKIYQNVTHTISSLFSSGQNQIIDDTLSIIESLTTLKLNEGFMIYAALFNDLIGILQQLVTAQNEDLVPKAIETITSTLMVDINAVTMQNMQNFSGILLNLANYRETVLICLARLRSQYDILEKIFDQIYTALIKDVIFNLPETQVEAFSVIRFIRCFDIRKPLIPLLLELTVHFIKSESTDVSEESLGLICKIIQFLIEEQQNAQQEQQNQGNGQINLKTIVDARLNIITATFTALTDTLHKPIFENIAQAIQALYQAMSVASLIISPDQFDRDFCTVLKTVVPTFQTVSNPFNITGSSFNPDEFLVNFSKALRGHMNDFSAFCSDLKEFLVTTNCASPSDKFLFKSEIKLDSIEEELMNLVAGEEKNAIVAEELDILPALKNFTI